MLVGNEHRIQDHRVVSRLDGDVVLLLVPAGVGEAGLTGHGHKLPDQRRLLSALEDLV